MQIDAFLADSVDKVNGKLYVLGAGWNVIAAPRLPSRHSRIGIGMLIRVPYTETDSEHTLQVSLEDADGHVLPLADAPGSPGERVSFLAAKFRVGRPPVLPPGAEQIMPMAMNIDGLVFQSYGQYRFVITVDGAQATTLSLSVAAPPKRS